MKHRTHRDTHHDADRTRFEPKNRWTLAALAAVALAILTLVALHLPAGPQTGSGTAQPEETDAMNESGTETGHETGDGSQGSTWDDVERLVTEQKFQAALDVVSKLREAAAESGDSEELLEALVREVQLQAALHGYERSVRFLQDAEASGLWPGDPGAVLVHRLFYAHTLHNYLQAYSWQIRQRERTTSADADLDQWTLEQIATEIHGAFADAWALRRDWGSRPLGEMARFLEQNSYPARIRGTLRDSLSHLWVDLLRDRSLWTPEQSNEAWKLDLPELLETQSATPRAADSAGSPQADAQLVDPDVHPLRKIHLVLADLEAWHREGERPEAAFDARRALIGELLNSFGEADDRATLRRALEDALERLGKKYPWWTMGQADLAEMVSGEDRPWALRDARDLALDGKNLFPESAGARRCAYLVARWESPSVSLQAMEHDAPGRRSVLVRHSNVQTLHFRAVRWDVLSRLETSTDRFDPRPQDVARLLGRTPVAEWTVELPPTPDLRSHQTFVTPPLEDLGSYLVLASTSPSFDRTTAQVHWVPLHLTELALRLRGDDAQADDAQAEDDAGEDDAEVVAEVLGASTGEPLEGVEVAAWFLDWRSGHRRVTQAPTDARGRVRLPARQNGNYMLVASRGDDHILRQTWAGGRRHEADPQRQTLIYTDRALYRPGQTVHWKIVAYEHLPDGTMEERSGETVEVRLMDANGEEVAATEVTTNEWASASGTFGAETGRALGSWSIQTSWNGHAQVQVEEYKRPTFEVTVKEPAQSLRFGHAATVTGEARYYFGAPLTGGEVTWRVTRAPMMPPWWGWRRLWWDPSPPQVVASGTAEVGPDGTFPMEFTPEADPSLADREDGRQIPYAFRVEATVVDAGGETREGSAVLRAGFVPVQAAVQAPDGLVTAGEAVTFRVRRTNLSGAAAPGDGAWRLVRLVAPGEPSLPSELPSPDEPDRPEEADTEPPYRTDGDGLRPRWSGELPSLEATLARWTKGDEVASGRLRHDDLASEELAWADGLEAGAYALLYETSVEGEAVEAEGYLAVFGDDEAPPLPLHVQPAAASVEVGGAAEVLVHTGWRDQWVVVEAYGRGGRLLHRVLEGGVPHRLHVPATPAHRGQIVFEASLVRDHQELRRQASVAVPWTDKTLQVELTSFRDRLRPGQTESWTVSVRRADGEPLDGGPLEGSPAAAEVLASMYDRSLDAITPHQPPRFETRWPSYVPVPGWTTSVGQQAPGRSVGEGWRNPITPPSFSGDALRFYDGVPVGGPGRRMEHMAMRTLAKGASAAPVAESAMADQMVTESLTVTSEAPLREASRLSTASTVEESEAGDDGPGDVPPPEGDGLRTDFSETAFWEPHLLLTDDGSVAFTFEVPDAVTEWRVWLRALADGLRAGSYETTVQTSKDLLVRPYLPRFFREGDRAELRVVVSNQGESTLTGELDFDVVDPNTDTSRLADFGLSPAEAENVAFTVDPGAQTTLRFAVTAPKQPGEVAVRVLGRAEAVAAERTAWSDGELRPLPVLPSRLYLSQSRFAVLDEAERRTLRFEDLLADDDPTRDNESLVMTLDGQLLTTVLNALPYLVDYPYTCTEQSLNRFVSTGIVRRVFDDHPMVAELAKGLSEERDTEFEPWRGDDPNRRILLEETPWLRQARGGESNEELHRILDPEIAAQVRDESLARVLDAQTASGAFPWWPGGPPSPYMTLYVLDSFSRALEFGVEVPREPVVGAWRYLEQHYRAELRPRLADDATCCLPLAVYLGWMLSNYPDEGWTGGVFTDEDRERLLEHGFGHWRELSPRLKGYLALTLHRQNRGDDAGLVWESVMDSAKTDEDLGTYWAPEKMAWLWYNDTLETHAFALRVLGELSPEDERRSGLAQWLLVNKKLNHWKSTRATAEVLYSLVHYLKSQDLIGVREEATVRLGERERTFVFAGPEATAADRRQQWVMEGPEIEPAMGEIEVSKNTPGFLLASATWHFATDRLPAAAEGDLFRVERRYFRRVLQGDEWTLQPLAEGAQIEVGDQLEVQLDLRAGHAAEYVHLRDPRGAGFEPEDQTSGYRWDGAGHYREIRDSATNFFFEWLPAGQYVLTYRVRAAVAGTFRVGPAQLQSMYAPEFVAYSAGSELTVAGGE